MAKGSGPSRAKQRAASAARLAQRQGNRISLSGADRGALEAVARGGAISGPGALNFSTNNRDGLRLQQINQRLANRGLVTITYPMPGGGRVTITDRGKRVLDRITR